MALSALVVAVPTEAQTITVPGALREFTAIAGDGRVRLLITAPRNFREGTYQFRFATGATVPAETAWTVLDRPYFGSVILTGLTNGTAYAFEVRAVNTTGGGPAATAAATPQRAACPAPALGSRRQVLRATLAVGAGPPSADGDVTIFGYAASARDGRAVGALSDTGFQVGATGYSISELSTGNPYSGSVEDGDLVFWFDGRDLSPAHRAALRLHVCDTAYDFSGADYNPDDFTPGSYVYIWQHGPRKVYPVDLDWGLLVDRTVSLSLPPNTPATGTPTVTGTVRVGQVLTAATGTIADADGLTLADAGEAGFGYTYQWVRVDADGMSNPADLPGATGATYTVTASDVGKRLKVRVSFTDDLNSEEARESDGTVANSVPTASDGRVTARENQDYTFTAADFNYADSDGDPLASVTIKVRPESGALKLDNARVRVDAAVTRAQLDAGSLTYTPPTDQTGTGVPFFLFAVSDGIAESTSVYRIDIDIAADTVAPGRPRNLTAVPGNGAVALRWEAPSSPGSSAIVRYEVRHAAGDAVPPATAWESVGLTFTHPVTGLADGPHTFEVRAVNSSTPSEGTAAQVRDTPSATLTPTVSMEEVEVRVAEDAGTAVVTVLLDRPSTAALTVPWETADDTAVSPDDYIGGEGSVTFAPGETRNTLSVRIVDDPLLEDPVDGRHERFWVLPSRGDGYRLENGGEAVSVVIEDNDGDGPVTANTPATGAPTITGTAQVGQQLTAVTTGIMDADGLTSPTYTYQWIRVDTDSTEQDISGATSSTYTLVAADEGKTIKVKVSFTDDASHPETLTSAATAAVTAAVTATGDTPATGAPTITGTAPTVGDEDGALPSRRRHHRHQGRRRADQRQLHVPVDPGGHRQHRAGHTSGSGERGDLEHLHAGGGRPGQDHQGQGELHRRRQPLRDADQRGDGDGGRGSDGPAAAGDGEHPRDRRADDHGHGAGRADAHGGHHRHQGRRRAEQRQLHVPVDPGGHRQHRAGHFGGDLEHLHPGGGRRGQDHQGQGELHRRRQPLRDADQRGDGDGGRGSDGPAAAAGDGP